MNIYLLGYMGCGKTKTGRRLAAYAGLPFTDLDRLFENRCGIAIADYFAQHSEEEFRKAEAQLLRETALADNRIVALGGGTPCFGDNMEWLKGHGFTVYLKMNETALLNNLCRSRKRRPLLEGLDREGTAAKIREQLPQREQYYRQADLTCPIPPTEIPQLWETIQKQIQSKKSDE